MTNPNPNKPIVTDRAAPNTAVNPNVKATDAKHNNPNTGTDVARHFLATTIDGMRVYNSANEELGTVKDLVIDLNSGKVVYAALDFGGWLGIGDKLFAVPFHAFKYSASSKDHHGGHLVLDVAKDRLKNAPGFDKSKWPDMADPTWAQPVDQFYGHPTTAAVQALSCWQTKVGNSSRLWTCRRQDVARGPRKRGPLVNARSSKWSWRPDRRWATSHWWQQNKAIGTAGRPNQGQKATHSGSGGATSSENRTPFSGPSAGENSSICQVPGRLTSSAAVSSNRSLAGSSTSRGVPRPAGGRARNFKEGRGRCLLARWPLNRHIELEGSRTGRSGAVKMATDRFSICPAPSSAPTSACAVWAIGIEPPDAGDNDAQSRSGGSGRSWRRMAGTHFSAAAKVSGGPDRVPRISIGCRTIQTPTAKSTPINVAQGARHLQAAAT